MFDLGDEFVIGSERIPWLLWMQFLVMLLLLILLYHLVVFFLGVDLSSTAVAALPDSADLVASSVKPYETRLPSSATTSARSSGPNGAKVSESQSIKNGTGTSSSKRRVSKEGIHEREGDSSQVAISERSYHPCHYFGLAKQAFLKCLGLDSTSIDSSNTTRQQRKEQ